MGSALTLERHPEQATFPALQDPPLLTRIAEYFNGTDRGAGGGADQGSRD